MKTSSDYRSGALLQQGLSVGQVGRPKTFGKLLDDEQSKSRACSGWSAASSIDDFGADRLSGQACGHARFIRTPQRRHSDRARRAGYHQFLTAAYLATVMAG